MLTCAGCYISKLSYVRPGEKSLDGYYRPFHMVEYYRYVRFFPDGKSNVASFLTVSPISQWLDLLLRVEYSTQLLCLQYSTQLEYDIHTHLPHKKFKKKWKMKLFCFWNNSWYISKYPLYSFMYNFSLTNWKLVFQADSTCVLRISIKVIRRSQTTQISRS